MRLGEVISEYRKKHKLSLQKFADAAGLSKPYVRVLEQGKGANHKPVVFSFQTLVKAAKGMKMDVDDLMRMIDDFFEYEDSGTADKTKNLFPERVKARREELEMSREELAHITGYKSVEVIKQIEEGKKDIPQSKIPALARALITTPDYLTGWTPYAENSAQVLSEDELELVDSYRQLTDDNKQAVKGVVNKSLSAQQIAGQNVQGNSNIVAGGDLQIS